VYALHTNLMWQKVQNYVSVFQLCEISFHIACYVSAAGHRLSGTMDMMLKIL
jgi:hypothetical protein